MYLNRRIKIYVDWSVVLGSMEDSGQEHCTKPRGLSLSIQRFLMSSLFPLWIFHNVIVLSFSHAPSGRTKLILNYKDHNNMWNNS